LGSSLRQTLHRIVLGVVRNLQVKWLTGFRLYLHERNRLARHTENMLGVCGVLGITLSIGGCSIMHIIAVFARPTAIDMPFANVRSGIAQWLQVFGDSILFWIQTADWLRLKNQLAFTTPPSVGDLTRGGAEITVPTEARTSCAHTRLDTATRWRAHAGRSKGATKDHAIFGQLINHRRLPGLPRRHLNPFLHLDRRSVPRHVISEDENEVRLLSCSSGTQKTPR
jgi:hypothetical protein